MLHHDLAAPQDLPTASSTLLILCSGEPAVAGFAGVLRPLPALTPAFDWMRDFFEIDITPRENAAKGLAVFNTLPVTRITARTAADGSQSIVRME